MKSIQTLFVLSCVALLAGCGQQYAPQNPLAMAPTPTPVPCAPPGPAVWDDFSSGTTLNTSVTWGDAGTSITSVMETTISNGNPNSWHLTPKPSGYGCGANILATNGAILNAKCKTLFKYDIRSSAAATYTIRFKEDGATGVDQENWVSPAQTSAVGTTFNTIAIPVSTFTEDAYGDPACAGSCNAAGKGDNTIELDAIKRIEVSFTAPTSTFDVYIDNIRFE